MSTVVQSQSTQNKKTAAKNRHVAVTHNENVYGPLCGVQFFYSDNNKPLSNRYVLYWLFDSSGAKLESSPQNIDYWKQRKVVMPVGIAKTDNDGHLQWSKPILGCQFITMPDQSVKVVYNRPLFQNVSEIISNPQIFCAGKFPLGRKVGFMVMPLDIVSQLEMNELIKLPLKNEAWVNKIEKNNQVINLQCTLPEWAFRIRKQTRILQQYQKLHTDYLKDHVDSITRLEFMSSFVQYNARFPGKNLSYSDISRAKTLIQKVETLKKAISDQFVTNTDTNTYCGKMLSKINDAASQLWLLIKNKDLVDELMRYKPYSAEPTDHPVRGPNTINENGWKDIYKIIGEAYASLSISSVGEKVFDEHIEPFFSYLASLSPEGHPDWNSNKSDFLSELKKSLPKETFSTSDNPLIKVIEPYTTLTQAVVARAPGPPCLIEAVLNAYGTYLSKNISQPNPVRAAKYIRSLFGLMKLMRMGKALTGEQQFELASAANWGDLAQGRKALFDYTKDIMAENYGKFAAGLYKGSMVIFAAISFWVAVTDSDEKNTLKKWTRIVASSSNLALMTIGPLFAKYETALLFKIGTGSLAIVGGLAGIILSSIDVRDAYKNKETGKLIISGIAVLGSFALTLGFALTAFGATTFWTGIGALLALIGVIVTVVTSLVLLLINLFTKESESVFKGMRQQFGADEGVYHREYEKNPKLAKAYDELISAESEMSWWLMSWRAIVPLYNMGFVIKDEKSGQEDFIKTAKNIEKLIDDHSDSGSDSYIEYYLNSYKRAQKNPTFDLDDNGVCDLVEWQNGTINSNRYPPPNNNF